MPQTRGLQDRRSVSDNFEERRARASLLHARSRWPCPLFISDRLCACDVSLLRAGARACPPRAVATIPRPLGPHVAPATPNAVGTRLLLEELAHVLAAVQGESEPEPFDGATVLREIGMWRLEAPRHRKGQQRCRPRRAVRAETPASPPARRQTGRARGPPPTRVSARAHHGGAQPS